MRCIVSWVPILLLTACGGQAVSTAGPSPLILPDSVVVLEAGSGAPLGTAELLARLAAADFVLLGELHDNAIHHRTRGALITASASRRPAIVFEQFAASGGPLAPPAAGESRESWLDAQGFDRTGWRWPLHAPVVEAALTSGRAIWGSGVSREALRSVVRQGPGGAPEDLRRLMEQAPLDAVARAAIDSELVVGHCGQLPEAMIPGMRTAQEVRDASMTRALLSASVTGPAWLIAGNGHVRADVAVPRLLRTVAPGRKVLVVGLLERGVEGGLPGSAERQGYDLIIVTPPAVRTDPCASLRR
jgi:uncharacterized iron-regulated protein